jgi:hypothetical protein
MKPRPVNKLTLDDIEPPRVSRRLFCLSHAAMADPASFE